MDTKHFKTERIRNIGIIAHIDAGKTTTSERILYYAGITHKLGSVDAGTAVTDWMDQERERGITIVSAAITAQWREHQINIIDTPGHIDFTAEVQRALRILDAGVVIFDGVHGVESQSETVWRQADRFQVPRLCFINKMDRVGAFMPTALDSIRQRLQVPLAVMQLPLGEEGEFSGVIDLLSMQGVQWLDDDGGHPIRSAVPDSMKASALQAREQLYEAIADTDDDLLERYLTEKPITIDEWRLGLRRATLSNQLFPVLFGASLRNVGVQLLLDAIVDLLPSPQDIKDIVGVNPDTQQQEVRSLTEQAPLAALVFKIVADPFAGRMAYVRVYSGRLTSGSMVLNATRRQKERVGRLVRVFADHREDIDYVPAGEIDAVLSMKQLYTGDTLCDPQHPILLESIQFPNPVISIAIEPVSSKDKDEVTRALLQLSEEDPTFKVRTDPDTGQTVLSGMGELHLEILVDRIQREHQVSLRTGKPQVNYKETITTEVQQVDGRYIHQTGGRGQYGHVVIDIAPASRGSGICFVDDTKGGVIPAEFIDAVEKGICTAASVGLIGGLSTTDVRVSLVDGSSHRIDSSELAFTNAAAIAFKKALLLGSPVLLEPIAKIEVITPSEYLGDVLGQLNSKRCMVDGTELLLDGTQAIYGYVPLSEMFGYATDLRSITKGRAIFTIEFDHFDAVPERIMNRLMDKWGTHIQSTSHATGPHN